MIARFKWLLRSKQICENQPKTENVKQPHLTEDNRKKQKVYIITIINKLLLELIEGNELLLVYHLTLLSSITKSVLLLLL